MKSEKLILRINLKTSYVKVKPHLNMGLLFILYTIFPINTIFFLILPANIKKVKKLNFIVKRLL